MPVPESIDGESLNTLDWIELLESGPVMDYELGETSDVPMTIEVNAYDNYISDDCYSVVSSDDRSDDESMYGDEKDFSSSSCVGHSAVAESELDAADSFRI